MRSCLRGNTGNGNDSRLLFFCLIRMTTGLFKKQEGINAVGMLPGVARSFHNVNYILFFAIFAQKKYSQTVIYYETIYH